MPVSLQSTATTANSSVAPPGLIVPFAGNSAPNGWLLCNGSSYSTSAYPNLYSAIGFNFGGSGSSFNVPDYRGKVPAGLNANDGNFVSIGQSGGEANHVLSVNEMPSHSHGLDDPGHGHNVYDPGHSHFMGILYAQWVSQGKKPAAYEQMGSGQGIGLQGSGTGINIYQSGTGINFSYNGGGQAHYNLQPYITTNFIIKT